MPGHTPEEKRKQRAAEIKGFGFERARERRETGEASELKKIQGKRRRSILQGLSPRRRSIFGLR